MYEYHSDRFFTVTDLTHSIRGILESSFPFVAVTGEISNLRRPFSGHMYFTLKDHDTQLKAVLFKQQQRYLSCSPKDGMQALCRGRISVYEARGEYQLIIDTLEDYGRGALQIAFEDLKKKLAAEGLFDQSHKKPLPYLAEKITLITSPGGAAVHDFIQTVNKRFSSIPIEVIPVKVQGKEAAEQINKAIALANARGNSQVIALCRGGGSIEDLWPFNEESVVRAIFSSDIPVITGVGHEIDFTIADFVADYRALTPTSAAEAIAPDREDLIEKLSFLESKLIGAMKSKIELHIGKVNQAKRLLRDPSVIIAHQMLKLDHLQTSLIFAYQIYLKQMKTKSEILRSTLLQRSPSQKLHQQQHAIKICQNKMKNAIKQHLENLTGTVKRHQAVLEAMNPKAILSRGYALTYSLPSKKLLKDISQVNLEQQVKVQLSNGNFDAQVKKIL